MKKRMAWILTVCMMLSFAAFGVSAEETATDGRMFVKVKTELSEDMQNDTQVWTATARYRDTKEPIPLSMHYGGRIYATIPKENADREIEPFLPEDVVFTDVNDENPDFHSVEMLARCGVIQGDDTGEARIYDPITRAEATAMVLRLLGLEGTVQNSETLSFTDVLPTDWFCDTVAVAYQCGIVQGDSAEEFSPNRNVSREEITVMAANALRYADLFCAPAEAATIQDKDAVSDWAKEAYAAVGSHYIFDYTDGAEAEEQVWGYYHPQAAATRAEVASLLNGLRRNCQFYATPEAEEYGFDEKMPIIDGFTSTYPFTNAVYWSLFVNADANPQYPQKHSKSHASYERLINGEVDMLFASVYPASDILALAEENGVELELIPIAYDAMIFFTNKDNPITGLMQEQIRNIYVNDAYENWSELGGTDALFYPYCRNNDSGSHAQMERHFLNGAEIHPNIRKETSYTMSDVLTDVMGAKTEEPLGYALGYSIYYYYHNMYLIYPVEEELKLLAIDGVMPTDETIADGSYPLSNNTYIVLRKDTPKDAPARKMAEFMLTEQGQDCVTSAGFGRLIP